MPLEHRGVFRTPVEEHPPSASLGQSAYYAVGSEILEDSLILLHGLEIYPIAVLHQLGHAESMLQVAQLIVSILG